MMFSKKSELELFKKQQAELIREEKRLIKELQEKELRSKQQSRQDQIEKIKDLEDKLLLEIENKARRSRNSSLDHPYSLNSSSHSLNTSRNDHLDKMREIQDKARNLINGHTYLQEIPEKPLPPKIPEPHSPVKIPVMIPQSMMRKAQNLPPPTIQRVLKNGEVVTVHLLSDKSRVNDPLVKAEAQVEQSEIVAMAKQMKGKPMTQVISEIQNQFMGSPNNNRSQSLPPKKKFRNQGFQLPEAEMPENREATTPKGKAEYYNFRDIALDVVSQQTSRTWVSQRMRQYSDKVKKNYQPKMSERKELEMMMMMERLKRNENKIAMNRVKLI